jgi:hypothetical protein
VRTQRSSLGSSSIRQIAGLAEVQEPGSETGGGRGLGQGEMAVTSPGKNRIMIYGPKENGTYVIEFRTAADQALAISILSSGSPESPPTSFLLSCAAWNRASVSDQALSYTAGGSSPPHHKLSETLPRAPATNAPGGSWRWSVNCVGVGQRWPVVTAAYLGGNSHCAATRTSAGVHPLRRRLQAMFAALPLAPTHMLT